MGTEGCRVPELSSLTSEDMALVTESAAWRRSLQRPRLPDTGQRRQARD